MIGNGMWVPFVPDYCPACRFRQTEPIATMDEIPSNIHRCPKCDTVFQIHVYVSAQNLRGEDS